MFDAPVDTWYLWLGVATVGVVAFGTVTSFPTTAPPDATRAAATVDAVAGSEYDATGEQPLVATEVRVGRHRLALRNAGGTTHATLTHGPVTPTEDNSTLHGVLRGQRPSAVFESPADLERAARRARRRAGTGEWRRADGRLLVRHVTWGELDVTLVGT